MLRALQQALAAWWKELFPLALMNVVWLSLSVLIIPAGPATAAYYVVAQSVADGQPASWAEFWGGFRQYFWKGLRWGLLQVLIYFIGLFNFFHYAQAGGTTWGLIKIVWGSVLVIWTTLQILYWPLMLESDKQSIANTLRNALVMLWLHPFFVLVLALITALIIVGSMFTVAFVGLGMVAIVSLLGTFAVRNKIRVFQGAR